MAQRDLSMFQLRNLEESILRDFEIPPAHKSCGGASIWSRDHRIEKNADRHLYIGYACDCKKTIFYLCTLDDGMSTEAYSILCQYVRK